VCDIVRENNYFSLLEKIFLDGVVVFGSLAKGKAIPLSRYKNKNNMKYSKAEKAEAKARLLEWIEEGSTVHTILRHVSSSGMFCDISVVVVTKDGQTFHPNYAVACLLGESVKSKNGHDAIRVTGCGMDMGFHIVHCLSYYLFGKDGALRHHQWI